MHEYEKESKTDNHQIDVDNTTTHNKVKELIESTANASISVIQEVQTQTLYSSNQDNANLNKRSKNVKNTSKLDLNKEDLADDILEYGIASTDLVDEIDKNVIEILNKNQVNSLEEENIFTPAISIKETRAEIKEKMFEIELEYQGVINSRDSNQKRRESIREGIRERRNSLIGKIYSKIEREEKSNLLNFDFHEIDMHKKIKDNQIHTQRSINFKAAFSKIINELTATVKQINDKLKNMKINQDYYSMTVESSHYDSILIDDDNNKINSENLERNLKIIFRDLCVKNDVINSLDILENKTINYECSDKNTLLTNKLTKEILESHYSDYKKLVFEKMKETDCTQIEARNKFLNEKIIKEKQKYEYNKNVLEDLLDSIMKCL